jgi:rhamnogalacturonan endolyase
MKRKIMMTLALLAAIAAWCQPRYDMNRINRERLDRGVVAVRQDEGRVIVSWRTLADDKKGQAYDVYRNGEKLNSQPLTTGGTFFIDNTPLDTDATYEIRGGSKNGSYTLKAGAPHGYIPIPLVKPADGISPDGRRYSYTANDASVGDVDGDGQYEIIVKWDPSNSHDNAHDGFTGNTLFDCYRLSGEHLWRIDMGPNIRSGAHYVPFIVYDLDGDGRAELMVKTADGTVDAKGKIIGDGTKDWRDGAKEALANTEKNRERIQKEEAEREKMRKEWEEMRRQGIRPDRNEMRRRWGRMNSGKRNDGRILSGPEYITVFNGLTGEAMATADYIPERGNMRAWGDDHGNRSERYLAGVGYFDGQRASAFFCRGYYTRTVIAAWDWDGKQLTNRWTFDTNNPKWKDYAGQGNHNLRVADVDGDGKDEITYGSMAVDHDGTGLYNTRMGHGDAMHLTAFDPTTDKLQVWSCHENRRDGSELRDAATGKVIFQIKSKDDVGRCMAADIDPTNPGLEMWSSDSHGIRNIKGELVLPGGKKANGQTGTKGYEDDTALFIQGMRLPTNFGIWWDGDLLREMLDHERVSKYDWTTGQMVLLKQFADCQFNNGTKSNPCLSADIIGDWREEVLTRTRNSEELRIYVSTIPTDYRINCLMEDIPYRLSVAAENVGYNQPPETGYYLGPDKTDYLK